MSISVINSKIISYPDVNLPSISYYNSHKSVGPTALNTMDTQLKESGCSDSDLNKDSNKNVIAESGIIKKQDLDNSCYSGNPDNSTIINLIKNKNCNSSTRKTKSPKTIHQLISDGVDYQCANSHDVITNQIHYLACQLVKSRTREYDGSKINASIPNMTLKGTFNMLPQFKLVLCIILLFTMYLLIYGILSSFDVTMNIFNVIRLNSVLSLSYWTGLLFGMTLPFVILVAIFIYMSRMDNKKDETVLDITDNPEGVPVDNKNKKQEMDYVLILLFMFVIYGLIAVLFIIPEGIVSNNILHSLFAYSILILISILLYIFYLSIPTFDGTAAKNEGQKNIIHLFIKKDSEDINFIKNDALSNFRKAFIGMIIFIFIGGILFFKIANKPRYDTFFSNAILGCLSSFAILIMPVVWIFNVILAINYFLFYPVILMAVRFIRSIGMSITHLNSLNKDRSQYSQDFIDQLEHINDYSPSWNLIGIGPIKAILNMNGYENEFSETYINSRNTQKNLAQDKYIFSGLFRSFMQNNNKYIIINVIIFILTIIFSSLILYNVFFIKNS